MSSAVPDIRYDLFQGCMTNRVTAVLTSEGEGVISGLARARVQMESLGMLFISPLQDGSSIHEGQELARVIGNPVQAVMAEEQIIGTLSKTSGIASAARLALARMGPGPQIVSGGWKKMPLEIKAMVRQAALDGGVQIRITEGPFVYLDKNYVRILGGVREAILRALPLGGAVVVQIRGETKAVGDEAIEAAEAGANIIMVDTGSRRDLEEATRLLKARGLRSRVRVAFSGDVSLEEIGQLASLDLDIVDIGYAILDAPSLPMRFDVIEVVQMQEPMP